MRINVSDQVYRWILLKWMTSLVRINSDRWDKVEAGSIIEVDPCGGDPTLRVRVKDVVTSTGIQSLVTCKNYLQVLPSSSSVGGAQHSIAHSMRVSLHDQGNMYILIDFELLT